MKKIIEIVNKYVTPFANKISRNVWVASLQDSVIITLPLALTGSIVSVVSILNNFIDGFPDLSPISTFTFGLIGIAIAFVLPANLLQRKDINSKRYLAGIASVGAYLMFLKPEFLDTGAISFILSNLGTGGMFLAIITGYITSLFFILFDKWSFFKNNDSIPEVIITSFDSILPILSMMIFCYVTIYIFNVDFFAILTNILSPLTVLGQSYGGLVVNILVTAILYSFGISPWLLYGLFFPIILEGITQNGILASQGLAATNFNIAEINAAFITIGGWGTTLPLAFLLLKSKSKRLSAISKAAIVPAIFNINEPIVFGAPIMLNPMLMIPFWINSFLIPTIVYFAFDFGLVTVPTKVFNMFFVPSFLHGMLTTQDWRSLILTAVVILVAGLVWYPFWKAYDQQLVTTEKEGLSKA